MVIYHFTFHLYLLLFQVKVYIRIPHYISSMILWYHLLKYLSVLQDLQEYPHMLHVNSRCLHYPCDYCKRYSLDYALHSLFLGVFHWSGPNWSIKSTVLHKRYTVSPLLILSLPPYLCLLQSVIFPWYPRKSWTPSVLSSSTYRSVSPILPCLISS